MAVGTRDFTGFGPEALPFFKALAFVESRDWFEANRTLYEGQVKGPLGDLVETVSQACAATGLPFRGDRKRAPFRIHRDVRFSKDKSPYKTNAGAVLTRGGGKHEPGLLYLHIAPEGCFMAAGFYQPDPEQLARLRSAIARAPDAWRAVTSRLAEADLALSEDEALKRMPRGFDQVAELDLAAAIRNRHFVCSRPIPEPRLAEPALVQDVVAFARSAMPLLEWGWSAIIDTR